MKPSLQLSVSNQLKLTPQLQQAIRLLQLSTIDLRHEIQQQLECNPLLELSANEVFEAPNDPSMDHEDEQNDFQWSTLYGSNSPSRQFNESEYIFESLHCTKDNLHDHLLWQINLTPITDIDKVIATTIIDAIDDNGFLTASLKDIRASLHSKEYPLSIKEIEAVLHLIQRLDPVGCGAQDLAETLLIQLDECAHTVPHPKTTKEIISNHLQLIGQHHYKELLKIYHIDQNTLDSILNTTHHLHPNPGSLISEEKANYVVPDVIIKRLGTEWHSMLNPETLPKLNINTSYTNLINESGSNLDKKFIKENLQDARYFLKGIANRQDTMLKVVKFILSHQKDFFDIGEEAMRPLTLNEVAEALNMHESTISRITTQKYILTPRGVYELKFFFSGHISTTNGDEQSSTSIRALLKKLIGAENPKKPFSDNQLLKLLAEQGINIARRTITKYREAMGIPPSYERKHI
jgi:RNA polymerase sigma-54 factor